jgi:hypothetical protein
MSRDHSLSEQLCHWALPSAMMSVGVLTFVAVARHSNAEAGAASGVVGIGSMTFGPVVDAGVRPVLRFHADLADPASWAPAAGSPCTQVREGAGRPSYGRGIDSEREKQPTAPYGIRPVSVRSQAVCLPA